MSVEKLFVEPGARLRARTWTRGLAPSKRVILVSESGAWRRFGLGVEKALTRAGLKVHRHLLPSGEAAKSWDAVSDLLSAMLAAGLGRDSAVVAMGGGSVTDAAGFAAAIYQRGIPWVSMPTTLLGQLDSGLGGKTGINLSGGKNLAGCFHRPRVVVCDPDVLSSLPPRERVSGFGEALKYGLVFEPAIWGLIVGHWDALMAGDAALTGRVVARCAAWKRRIVDSDERETKGPREFLNFGHTLGHALESASGLGVLRHGEAVIWGMRAALRLSHRCSGLKASFAAEADCFLATLPVPLPRRIEPRRLLAQTRRDKKARGGRARFVLLRAPGKPLATFVSDREILRVLGELL
ncbi:MAG: 3-dehydroquinate synthase [Elusimicrobia bacterium CG11_big_fil_rev_8_21_14_0_20_64_6]|nr:MAG: 3-dehydroquinate synthase [Elusimicrobia bacterium CG11_big_fil_rev_8_21_14_0_20_64_6]